MTDIFFADLVGERIVASGSGALPLAGALPGHRDFASILPPGAHFHYAIRGIVRAEQWEVGEGVLDGQGWLVRGPLASSANNQAVDFGEGVKTCVLTVAADWFAAIGAPTAPAIGDVAGLQAALDAKQPAGAYAPAAHGHPDHVVATPAGNVGIGTAAGTGRLTVDGTVSIVSAGTTGFSLTANRFAAPRGAEATLDLGGNLVLRNLNAGSIFLDSFSGAFFLRNRGAGSATVFQIDASASVMPGADNVQKLGAPTLRWSTIYAGSGAISTSDEREKKWIGRVPAKWLDAWDDVGWARFQFRRRRRWHVGLVAQAVRDAFAAGGLDACKIGLLCRDDLSNGGERWGLRYDECFALEAAWQRRELTRLEARIATLEC